MQPRNVRPLHAQCSLGGIWCSF